MDRRGSITARRAPGRFRCLPCQRIVVGTESGHCPHCGFVPPSAAALPPERAPINGALLLLVIAAIIALAVFVTN